MAAGVGHSVTTWLTSAAAQKELRCQREVLWTLLLRTNGQAMDAGWSSRRHMARVQVRKGQRVPEGFGPKWNLGSSIS